MRANACVPASVRAGRREAGTSPSPRGASPSPRGASSSATWTPVPTQTESQPARTGGRSCGGTRRRGRASSPSPPARPRGSPARPPPHTRRPARLIRPHPATPRTAAAHDPDKRRAPRRRQPRPARSRPGRPDLRRGRGRGAGAGRRGAGAGDLLLLVALKVAPQRPDLDRGASANRHTHTNRRESHILHGRARRRGAEQGMQGPSRARGTARRGPAPPCRATPRMCGSQERRRGARKRATE